MTNYSIPISNGILEHRRKIGAAIWVFLWLIDATTKEVETADGKYEGLVYGGQPVALSRMTADLKMSWDGVYRHLAHLTNKGYIRKIDHGNGRANGYVVVNSKKFYNRRTPGKNAIGTPRENAAGTPGKSADDLPQKRQGPAAKIRTYYRKDVTNCYKTGKTNGEAGSASPSLRYQTPQEILSQIGAPDGVAS